jgi:hypothetical protein
MKKILYVVAGTALLALTGCGVIPGTGMYAGELVNRYLNTVVSG